MNDTIKHKPKLEEMLLKALTHIKPSSNSRFLKVTCCSCQKKAKLVIKSHTAVTQ